MGVNMKEYYEGKHDSRSINYGDYTEMNYFGASQDYIDKHAIPGRINGIDIKETKTLPNKGLVFYGSHNVLIGQLISTPSGRYELKLNEGAKEEISRINAIEKRKEQKRRYALKRRRKFIALGLTTALSIGAITSGITSLVNNHQAEKQALEDFRSKEAASIQMLYEAPVAVQMSWANYAMGMLEDDTADTEYEAITTRVNNIYESSFIPMCSKYNDMCEINEMDLNGQSLYGLSYPEKVGNEFASELSEFTSDISSMVQKNEDYLFVSSPYKDAIVLDTTTTSDTVVYIPLSALGTTSPYNQDNLPSDALIIEGKVYVPEQYLHDTYSNTINK